MSNFYILNKQVIMALSNNFKGQKKDGIITTGRKRAARSIRSTSRSNPDGSVSTHKMEWGAEGGKGRKRYSVNPTIFPEKDGSWSEKGGADAYSEAKKRGEVFGFRSAKRAEKFAAGSWKKGEARRESMKNYRAAKKNNELYTQSKEFKAERKANRKNK